MLDCSEYEVELSAIIDGESDAVTVVNVLDHVTQCASCRSFYSELRDFQAAVDDVSMVADTAPAVAPRVREKRSWFRFAPQWGLGLAAASVLIVGLWWGGAFERLSQQGVPREGGEVYVQLGEDRGEMDETRFVEIVTELLSADQRYQDQLYVVLDEMKESNEAGESGRRGDESELTRYDFPRGLSASGGSGSLLN